MKNLLHLIIICLLVSACNKNSSEPVNSANTATNNPLTARPNKTSAVSVSINNACMQVTSINFNRGSSTFNFSVENKLQKIDVNCFWFYQQNWASYQYSDSINYSVRTDTLSPWTTQRATGYGNVYFDCCTLYLTAPEVSGEYNGNFSLGKDKLAITGKFDLLFK